MSIAILVALLTQADPGARARAARFKECVGRSRDRAVMQRCLDQENAEAAVDAQQAADADRASKEKAIAEGQAEAAAEADAGAGPVPPENRNAAFLRCQAEQRQVDLAANGSDTRERIMFRAEKCEAKVNAADAIREARQKADAEAAQAAAKVQADAAAAEMDKFAAVDRNAQRALSADLCIARKEENEALARIKEEKANSRIAGVVNLTYLHGYQDRVASARRMEKLYLGDFKTRGVKPLSCSDKYVGGVIACGNEGEGGATSPDCNDPYPQMLIELAGEWARDPNEPPGGWPQ